jgi:hypothetical protein
VEQRCTPTGRCPGDVELDPVRWRAPLSTVLAEVRDRGYMHH